MNHLFSEASVETLNLPNPALKESAKNIQDGALIENYRLMEPLGEGGFGIVYRAEQLEPLRRWVALKVIKPGMGSHQILQRFESERQTLARMTHPNIAGIFYAGVSSDGRPYFAMELVEGEPITAFCNSQRFSIKQRIHLFVEVCQAVQHAHQKAILHRDLKPSNILLTRVDDSPTPKVIDFGIAKILGATADPLSDPSMPATREGFVLGTPQYMSPEQAAASADLDTRSDIYSLGAVLHELVVGVSPIDPGIIRKATSMYELCQLILEHRTPKPSTRISASGSGTTLDLAAERSTTQKAWVREVKGDLDWIILKALATEKELRYQSVGELAADLMAFLEQRPVMARAPTFWYVTERFLRRHWRVSASVLGVGLVGLVGWSALSWQRTRADSYRDYLDTALPELTKGGMDAFPQELVRSLIGSVSPELKVFADEYVQGEKEKWEHLQELNNGFRELVIIHGVMAPPPHLDKEEELSEALEWLKSAIKPSKNDLADTAWKTFETGLACLRLATVLEEETESSRKSRPYGRDNEATAFLAENDPPPLAKKAAPKDADPFSNFKRMKGQRFQKQPRKDAIVQLGDDSLIWRLRADEIFHQLAGKEDAYFDDAESTELKPNSIQSAGLVDQLIEWNWSKIAGIYKQREQNEFPTVKGAGLRLIRIKNFNQAIRREIVLSPDPISSPTRMDVLLEYSGLLERGPFGWRAKLLGKTDLTKIVSHPASEASRPTATTKDLPPPNVRISIEAPKNETFGHTYLIDILNMDKYPPEMFLPDPEVAGIGVQPIASRTVIAISSVEDGKRLFVFTGGAKDWRPEKLGFVFLQSFEPPKQAKLVFHDRKLNRKYESAPFDLKPGN
jgi:serine/threonine protein kinase